MRQINLRDIVWMLRDVKYAVSAFFNPRQKWLTKKIPKRWMDKCELIPLTLFEILVNYVEKEMDIVCWEWSGNYTIAGKEIKSLYKYIKEERPALQKELDDAYPEIGSTTGDYQRDYVDVDRLETLLDKRDEDAMIRIIKIRHYLWT